MGKKKKQEKQKEKQKDKLKKKLSSEEKKLLKAAKKEEKDSKAEGESKSEKEVKKINRKALLTEQKKEQPVRSAEEEKTDSFEKASDVISVQEATSVFRALGDEVRMEILTILKDEELCAMELLDRVRVVQSTLSHHMKVLTEAGLVCCRKDYKRVYYTIHAERMNEIAAFLQNYESKTGN